MKDMTKEDIEKWTGATCAELAICLIKENNVHGRLTIGILHGGNVALFKTMSSDDGETKYLGRIDHAWLLSVIERRRQERRAP